MGKQHDRVLVKSSRKDQWSHMLYEFSRQRVLNRSRKQWVWAVFSFLIALSSSKNASGMGTAPSPHTPVLPDRRLSLYGTVSCLRLQTPLEWCTRRTHTRSHRGATSGEWQSKTHRWFLLAGSSFQVRSPKNKSLFHNNIQGTGMFIEKLCKTTFIINLDLRSLSMNNGSVR